MSCFDQLTDEQRLAVTAGGTSIYVGAGPGSGKTRTMAARAAYLIEAGIDPSQILCLTFTRSAAANIRTQVRAACGQAINATTFHAFAARLVVRMGQRVATDLEAEAALKSLYDGPTRRRGTPSISKVRDAIVAWESKSFEDQKEAIDVMRFRLRESGLVATWDLIPQTRYRELPEIEHVLVDEIQDATDGELDLVSRMAHHVYGVGDYGQAIMGWRGACDRRPVTGTRLSLTQTFRFGKAIADVANQVAATFGGDPIVPGDVNSYVTVPSRDVLIRNLALGSVAVLCRNHHDCELAIRDLRGIGITDAVHIRRDPLDGLAQDADRIGDAIAARQVIVSTVHAAKGREFDVVLVDDSVFAATDSRSLRTVTDEDRRVLYVAVTRARYVLMMRTQIDQPTDAEGIPW